MYIYYYLYVRLLYLIIVYIQHSHILLKTPDTGSMSSFTENRHILRLVVALIIGFVLFVIIVVTLALRKSKGKISKILFARHVSLSLRILVIIEAVLNLILLVCTIKYGSPVNVNQFASIGKRTSWTYGYGRPLCGLSVMATSGLIAAAHPWLRMICICSAFAQVTFDSFSAFQVGHLLDQVSTSGAPTGLYSRESLNMYYWRDLLSVSISFMTVLLSCLLSTVAGWIGPIVQYSKIEGSDLDRAQNMRSALRHKLIDTQPNAS